MQVILLERIDNLGFIGDVVDVKNGFARNFLLPKGKALRANDQNLEYFKSRRTEIEADNLKQKSDAEKAAEKMKDFSISIIRQASESGMLFGSVRPGDIAGAASDFGVIVAKKQVIIKTPIKTVGNHLVTIKLHPEVSINVSVRVMTAQEQESNISISEDTTSSDE